MTEQTPIEQLAEIFSTMSDPSRLRIIETLLAGELNVSALAQQVGLSDSATSHHLRSLRQMRIVRARKDGRQVYYALIDEHVRQLFNIGLEHVLHE